MMSWDEQYILTELMMKKADVLMEGKIQDTYKDGEDLVLELEFANHPYRWKNNEWVIWRAGEA